MNVDRVENWTLLVMLTLLAAMLIVIALTMGAFAQGLYIGRDGRAHPSVIAGPDGSIWPVIPTYCQHGWGPCPVPLAPPIPPFAPPAYAPPPPAYAPAVPPPPPPPLGWIWGRLAPCANEACDTLVIQVQADGVNIRAVPGGPVIMSIANGVPVAPLTKEGNWVLVAALCNLMPTWTWSVTAGVPISVCS